MAATDTSTTTTPNTDTNTTNTTQSARPGVAGRIDYDGWHKKTKELLEDVEENDQKEKEANQAALGLDGKYAASAAEAEERKKAKDIAKAKRVLENYQKRESSIRAGLKGLLGPVPPDITDNIINDTTTTSTTATTTSTTTKEETKSDPKTVRITREMIDAGKRVVKLEDTSGASQSDTIVLTSDLSLLESKMKANAMQPVKSFPDDAENAVQEEEEQEEGKERSVFGAIKAFLSNVHNCTVLIKCKIISGTIEVSHCSNVIIRIEKDATVATIQADLCKNISIEFNDAPSGKNTNLPGQPRIYWGEDKEDRIFHAGVQNMWVKVYRDGYLETERLCDYKKDGAKAVGNATEEEFQFVTSVVDEELVTEAVVREGSTTGENARAMTQRELKEARERREKAAKMATRMAEDMIKFKETADGAPKVTKMDESGPTTEESKPKEEEKVEAAEEEIEEIYGSMGKEDIEAIVNECEKNKARGNEAFGAGEYAQAILLYSLALDKAEELPDAQDPLPAQKPLFPRDVTLTNRAACFLKMGDHEKAHADALKASQINPQNVKAYFRQGLALHAQKKYEEAIPILAKAHKLEPKNKQIKEALQFAEVRMTQEMRKRMEG